MEYNKIEAKPGKIFISKEVDDEGNPTVKTKIICLAENAKEEDFIEVDESEYENIEI